MDASILNWLDPEEGIPVWDSASVTLVQRETRDRARAAGLTDKAAEELAIVASELAQNQLRHAREGRIAVRRLERDGGAVVEVVAADRGGGIGGLGQAFFALERPERPPLGAGLGIGLGAVRRLSDELDVDVRVGEGSCLWARKLAADVARIPEVAIVGRRLEGERVAGDDATFLRRGGTLLVAVADGLGHGAAAREASSRAIAAVGAHAERALDDILAECARAMEDTRGCVIALARLDASARRIEHAAVGDVTATIFAPDFARRFVADAGVLGRALARRPRKPRIEEQRLATDALLVMCTDGIRSRLDLTQERALLRRSPIEIADHVLAGHARDHDDALVAVIR